MARPLVTMLREGAMIEASKLLNAAQKAHALSMLQKEIDAVTGQSSLTLEGTTHAGGEPGGVPPAPQAAPASARKA